MLFPSSPSMQVIPHTSFAKTTFTILPYIQPLTAAFILSAARLPRKSSRRCIEAYACPLHWATLVKDDTRSIERKGQTQVGNADNPAISLVGWMVSRA